MRRFADCGPGQRHSPSTFCEYKLHTLDEQHLLVIVDFFQLDFDDLALRGRNGSADEGGFDGELAMAAVDEDQQLHAARAAVVEERIEGGANGAAGVEHVVDQDDVAAVDIEAERAGNDDGAHIARGEVVAIEADVEDAGIDRMLFDAGDEGGRGAGRWGRRGA